MDKKSLTDRCAPAAQAREHGIQRRSSQTIYGGHSRSLRQTVVGLSAGRAWPSTITTASHAVHPERKLQLVSGENIWKGSAATAGRAERTPQGRGARGRGIPADRPPSEHLE